MSHYFIHVLFLYHTYYCLLIGYLTNYPCVLHFLLSKFFNIIFIDMEPKGNCGEDVCLTNASAV